MKSRKRGLSHPSLKGTAHVEDQAASAQYQNSCSWIHEIEDAPTYYPSKEEWDRPLEFIQGLHLKASAFGICKIVPPVMASASGAMVLGPTSFKFTARFQEVKSAEWQSWEDVKFVHDPQNYSISKFEAQANEFMRKKFGATGLLPPRMIELEYWRAREMSCKGKHDWVTYGNDVEGSAFSASPLDPLGSSKWNLKVLPKEPQSILRHISKIVPGVTDPFLYIGMLYATFAWHVEDHYLYSINYHHQGAPKTWYGVPSSHADLFEDAAARVVFHQAVSSHHSKGCEGGKDAQERVQEALQRKTAMFPPKLLLKEGVRVVRAVQQAGEFVVTFPRAYHAGFSHGFNIGEAVNFGTNDWFPFGQACHQRYTRLKKLPLLEHERLLCCEAISICQKLCPLVEDGAQRPHSHSSSERTVHQASQTAKITVASKGLAGNSKGGTAGHDCSLISEVAATSCIPTTQMMDLGVISKAISEEAINATHVDPQSYQRLGSGLRDLSRLEALVMEEKQRCSSFSSSCSCTFTGVDAAAASAARNPDLTTLRMFLSTVRAQFSDCHVLQRAGGGMVHPMPALSEGVLCFCCNTACYMGYGIMEMQQDNEAGAGEEDEEEAEDNCTTVPYCLKCCMQTLQLQQFEREDQPETDRRSALDDDEAAAEGLVLYWNKEAAQYKHWCMVIEPLLNGHRNPLPDLLEAREVPGGSAAAGVAGISLCISPDRKRRQGCSSSPLKSALCSSPYKKGRMWMGSCHDPASDPSCFDCEHVPGIIIQQIAKNTGMQRQHGGGDKLFAKVAAVAVEESSSTAPQSPSGGLLSKSRASLLIPRLSPMENGRENVPSDTCVDTEALGQTAVSLQKRLNAGPEFPNRCGVVDAPGCGMKEGCHCPVYSCSDDRNNNQDCRSCLGSTDPRSTGWTSFNELQASNKKQGRPFSIPHYQPLHDNHDCMIQPQNHIMQCQAIQDAPMLTSQDMSWLNNYLQCRQELRNSSSSHAQELLSATTTVHLSSLNAPINEGQQGQNPVHLTNWRPDSNVTPGKQHAKTASRVPVPSSSCLLEGSGTFVGSVEKKGQSNANLLYKKLTSSGISMADLHRMRREVKRQGFTAEQFLRAFQGVMHILEASGVASEGLLTTDRILNYLATCGRLKPHGLIGVSPGAWSQFQVEALAKNESSFVPLPKSSETLPRFRVEGCPEKGCETLQEAVQSPSAREWIGVHPTFDSVEAHLCVPSKRPASQQQQQWGYDTQLDLQTNMTQETIRRQRMLPGQTVGSLASRNCEFPAPLIPVTPASEQLKQPPVPEVGNRNQHCSLRELQQQQRMLKMASFAEQSRERKWDFTRGACRDETAAKDDGIPNLDCDQRHQQQQAALTPPSFQVSEFSKSFFRKVLSVATEAVPTSKKGAAVKSPPQSGRKQKLGECWRLAQGRQLSYPQHHQLQGRCLPPPRLNGAGSSRTAVDVWSTGSGLDALGIMKITSAPVQLKKQSCPTVMQQQHPQLHQGEWMVSNAAASMDISIRARLPPGFDTKVAPSSCHSKKASLHRHALNRSGLWQRSTGLQQGPRDDQEKLVKRKLSSSCSIRTQYSHNKQDWDMFLRKLQRNWPDMAAEVESLEHDQIWNMQALGPQFLEQVFGGSRDHAVEFTRVVLGGDVGHPLMRPIWKRVFPVPN